MAGIVSCAVAVGLIVSALNANAHHPQSPQLPFWPFTSLLPRIQFQLAVVADILLLGVFVIIPVSRSILIVTVGAAVLLGFAYVHAGLALAFDQPAGVVCRCLDPSLRIATGSGRWPSLHSAAASSLQSCLHKQVPGCSSI